MKISFCFVWPCPIISLFQTTWVLIIFVQNVKKHLRIPKGQSKAVKSKKDRQWNDQMKIDKNRNKDLQNTRHKSNDWVTGTNRNKSRYELWCSGKMSSKIQSRKQAKSLPLTKIYITAHSLDLERFHLFLELIVAGLD